ncbi:MAG: DNA-3-methyladenine glycosylase I, partial [bacterium]|nr:DNA-3-methyladenine glycosylase I [bacterium]
MLAVPPAGEGENRHRCPWSESSRLELDYHDEEWGVPVHDDRRLFEFLILEGAQAGLSWSTILQKREGYRKAFDNFEPRRIVHYSEKKIAGLLSNRAIVRNRRKIESAINNARACLAVQETFGRFDHYIWQFVGGAPVQNRWKSPAQIPAVTSVSEAMSRDLKHRGFSFVGPT